MNIDAKRIKTFTLSTRYIYFSTWALLFRLQLSSLCGVCSKKCYFGSAGCILVLWQTIINETKRSQWNCGAGDWWLKKGVSRLTLIGRTSPWEERIMDELPKDEFPFTLYPFTFLRSHALIVYSVFPSFFGILILLLFKWVKSK